MATNWALVSRVKSSRYREKVLFALDGVKTPTQIQKGIKIDKAHVTRALQDLVSVGLVECLTPDVRKFKMYRRTSRGTELLGELKRLNE